MWADRVPCGRGSQRLAWTTYNATETSQEAQAMTLNSKQEAELLDLLWDYLLCDPDHRDRVLTGWGTKTKGGLLASIKRALEVDHEG